jgi:bacillopeptidase F (M6 metalloprotease family)
MSSRSRALYEHYHNPSANKKLTKERNAYLKCLKDIKQYIRVKIRKSFDYDFGKGGTDADGLYVETITELDLIEHMIDEVLEKEGER